MSAPAPHVAFLGSTLLFAGLTPEDLTEVARLGVPVAYSTGAPIFAEGDEARGFYVVESGR